MKYIALVLITLGLMACTPVAKDETNTGEWYLPKGLSDCSIYKLKGSLGSYITVMRCPNSSTCLKTHQKHSKKTCTIDGDNHG